MLSIIICSRQTVINNNLNENIKNTVGCDYELIVIDNSENKYSIFEAYNNGIEKSKGEYLCFIHDDILFHTKGWGEIINRIFNNNGNKQIGLIGVAGAKSKTKLPSLWWLCPKQDKIINIIQHLPNGEIEKWVQGFGDAINTEVVVVDGVFMAMRKDNRIRFSTKMIGFHNYDLNISFEYKKYGYKILASSEIWIEHFSLGNISKEWIESSHQIYNGYNNILPLNLEGNKINKAQEIANAKWFIEESFKYKRAKIAFTFWLKLFCLNPFLKYHIVFLKKYVTINLKNGN